MSLATAESLPATETREPPPFASPGPGSWMLDAEHCERPHSRWIAQLFPKIYTEGFRAGMARYGLLLDTLECKMVNGFAYLCPRPVGAPPDAKGPPPKLLFKLITRLHPTIRRRIKLSAEALRTRLWREDARVFFEELWPEALARFETLQALDLDALDDGALIAHLEQLVDDCSAQIHDHFFRHIAGMLPVGDFLAHAIDWTGCEQREALALLDGYSPYSLEAIKELDTLVDALRADAEALEMVQTSVDAGATLEALRLREGATGPAMARWLDTVGQRIVSGHDVHELRGLEMPEVLINSLKTHLSQPPRESLRAKVDAATADLRARVPEADRATFDDLLGEARLVHPLRDAHSVIDFWLFGLLRRSLLAAGRRLKARGALHEAAHVVDLEHAEILSLLAGGPGPSADQVADYVAQRESLFIHQAPDVLGPPPSPPPPAEWLPAPADRVARAMDQYLGALFAPARTSETKVEVQGVPASRGVYTGIARLVLTAADFAKVQEGDVLVARITTPSYNVLLPMLGAVVTDRGGQLSHPAIVAREYGLPGVVGAHDATLKIKDGMRVEVNGTTGTVRIVG